MRIIKFLFRLFFKPSGTPPTRQQQTRTKPSKQTHAKPSKWLEVKVGHILDGDTVEVSNPSYGTFRVRLYAIDCPENGQEWGETATFGLIKMIGGRDRKVLLETHGKDKYQRILATIYTKYDTSEPVNINERMVMLGHAWVTRAFYDDLPQERKNQIDRLESWAKSKKVGLWQSNDPIPPWKWRKENTKFR